MNLILAIIFPLIAAVATLVVVSNSLKAAVKSASDSMEVADVGELESLVKSVQEELINFKFNPVDFVSRAQYEYASESTERLTKAIEVARAELRHVELELEATQIEVEKREVKIQDLKGAREEEAKLLYHISQEFALLHQEGENLRASLDNSLEHIQKMEQELSLTKAQAEELAKLQGVVTGTMDRLKELTVEGQEVERRLKVLSQQYRSLEEEYTKLVEQQFS
jgi:chromosome segregation ATPase